MLAGKGKHAAMMAMMGKDYKGKKPMPYKKGKKAMKDKEDMGALSAFAGKKQGRRRGY